MQNLLNQQVGNYTLHKIIGQGGYAQVYLGEHILLHCPAAIKIMQTTPLDTTIVESFCNEAQLLVNLHHPHIITVHEFGIAETIPYLVMDYASQGTLRNRHPRGVRLSLNTIAEYATQISAALQHAHNHKFIHRDVKPENVLLGNNGNLLLSDFGIAILHETTHQNTQEIIGTMTYMAPEQLQGKPTFASDQYALGIMTYEWLCGHAPFLGSSTEVCAQHLFTYPSSLLTKVPGLSSEIERVVFKALSKKPEQRYASIQAFTDALHSAISSTQIQSTLLSKTILTPTLPARAIAKASYSSYMFSQKPKHTPQNTNVKKQELREPDWITTHIIYPLGSAILLYLFLTAITMLGLKIINNVFTALSSVHLIGMMTGIFLLSTCVVYSFHISSVQRKKKMALSIQV